MTEPTSTMPRGLVSPSSGESGSLVIIGGRWI